MSVSNNGIIQKTLLTYELTPHQNVIFNYLIPSVTSFVIYVVLIASEIALIFRHYKDENPIWAGLTLFILYLPAICAYIVTISSWELWPEMEGCERDNIIWFMLKTLEHLCFPFWAMWRFAERVFWSIEAVRSTDEDFMTLATDTVTAPRTIELYFFFQAFTHCLPQILLQLNILMRQDYHINQQTADATILSLTFNLTKLAAAIAFYQRFKTQKLAGKQYPWFKSYKYGPGVDMVDAAPRTNTETVIPILSAPEEPVPSESRRSSDFYLEPELREAQEILRETSVVDGPQRPVFQGTTEPDFDIKRVVHIKGLPEDDLAGKLVSFFWWSFFLLVRILAISAFFFFYPWPTFWLLFAHFIVMISFLVYDVKSDDVKRAKPLFFVFIGLIYIFCIIEFKIKFKKAKFMYIGYFSLVFIENFIMCTIWWFNNVEDLQNDFWFRYIFYVVIFGSMISVTSMLLYLTINKPKKVKVGKKILE